MIEVVQALKYGNNLVTMSDDLDLIIIIIIIKNECHSNIIVNRIQGCSHSKKLQ